MNTRAIVNQLRNKRDRITRAIEIIESLNPIDHKAFRQYRKPRIMSKAARLRISRAKRAWWREHRRKVKTA